jgi:hypothetical protein
MKKPIPYALTAILIGFAVMMLPLALEAGPPTYTPEFMQPTKTDTGTTPSEESRTFWFSGVGKQPSNLIPSSTIFFSGLILALSVYVILKKRTV